MCTAIPTRRDARLLLIELLRSGRRVSARHGGQRADLVLEGAALSAAMKDRVKELRGFLLEALGCVWHPGFGFQVQPDTKALDREAVARFAATPPDETQDLALLAELLTTNERASGSVNELEPQGEGAQR